jgi:beta-N-acetylhexosaminidase
LLPTLLPGFAGTVLPGWLRDRLRAGLGGVCLFAQNISSSEQLRSLTEAILAENPYAIIAIDEEGGDVTRLFAATGALSPGNAVLGRLDDLEITRETAAMIGWSLRRVGCNVDFAPCVDINSRSDNPVIGVRSFGSDAQLVSSHGRAWVTGLQLTGVAATAKHFPGHGDTAQDSHVSLPVVDCSLKELRRRELLPFVAALQAGCRLIMSSHILLPQVDPEHAATMSRIVLHDLLRGELGFSGVIVSDALDMAGASGSLGMAGAAVAALRAGCDLLCLGTDNTDDQIAEIERAVGTAVADGDLASTRVSEAMDRVRRLASELETGRQLAGQPPREVRGWSGINAKLINTLDVRPEARDWRARSADRYTVVRLEAGANIAVGSTPWGPFAVPAFNAQPTCVITPEHPELPPFQSGQPVLIVGRDIHRHRFAREAVDQLRSQHVDVLVIDMGWPSADRRYAEVATFGASRLMGEMLLRWLAGSS